ncbi:MAG: hypothetical protein ACXAD7_21860 [Candidatus Kariarchaeaceae archaeon]|jgi:hypothetical protein
MTAPIVKCDLYPDGGLFPTFTKHGNAICSQCGEVNPESHAFFEFIGAYCPFDKEIHYRWINRDWSLLKPPLLRRRVRDEPIITPIKTEYGIDKHFLKEFVWNGDKSCFTPDYLEVRWTGFEQEANTLLRPADTGYSQISQVGMHTPFLAAIIEWLLNEDAHIEIANLSKHSLLPTREKNAIQRAIMIPTPSNIFKMLWVMHRLIPGWHHKRSLGRRSPSLLLQDEIRWTTNRLDDLDKVDRERLFRCGPEEDHWGVWPELWSKDISLGKTLAEFGPELHRLGIEYGETLKLIEKPNTSKNERSWLDIAAKLVHWPLSMEKGGKINLEGSTRLLNGFVANLKKNIGVSIAPQSLNRRKWQAYISSRLPLCWIEEKTRDHKHSTFTTSVTSLAVEILQSTLLCLEPWIRGETDHKLTFVIKGVVPENLLQAVKSFEMRIQDYNIFVEISSHP